MREGRIYEARPEVKGGKGCFWTDCLDKVYISEHMYQNNGAIVEITFNNHSLTGTLM